MSRFDTIFAVPYFVVIRGQGPAWVDSLPMREQGDWAGHAAFMNTLTEDGFVVLGGPIGDVRLPQPHPAAVRRP